MLPAVLLAACDLNADPDGEYVPPTEQGDSPEIVSGYVCAPSGLTLPYAYVYIPIDENGDGVEEFRYETKSDEHGAFEFLDLPAGQYTVHVVKGSYDIVSEIDYSGVDRLNVGAMCLDVGNLRLAVIEGDWDSIQEILDYLGFPYDLYTADQGEAFLSDPNKLAHVRRRLPELRRAVRRHAAVPRATAPGLRAGRRQGVRVGLGVHR